MSDREILKQLFLIWNHLDFNKHPFSNKWDKFMCEFRDYTKSKETNKCHIVPVAINIWI